ncbi:hypothetical protein Q4E40_11800 [Pontibacter sp. BT731]|uniref:hypothetical protein n=1 Tax=Pontibacter coccineus TaxID=3063328 RepID=UPI0026E39376|nr:hypothetical protein [Pontibacter sp. BT731]MDO6390814.1 hypothetical protein [Pontibacter sp. BT731]
MLKKWKSLSVTAGLATILLLGVTITPSAANLNNGKATAEATTVGAPGASTTASTDDTKPATPKKQKSVLDADVLESPLSFFNDLSSGSEEEESSDLTVKSSTIVLALKALAATLLSTIM